MWTDSASGFVLLATKEKSGKNKQQLIPYCHRLHRQRIDGSTGRGEGGVGGCPWLLLLCQLTTV